jgi:hypothetical protein
MHADDAYDTMDVEVPVVESFGNFNFILTTNPCYHSPKFFSVHWQLLEGRF